MLANLRHLPEFGVWMLGADNNLGPFKSGMISGWLQTVHVLAVAAVVVAALTALAGLVAGIVRGTPAPAAGIDANHHLESWRLEDMLLIAFVADLALFVLLALDAKDPSFARYLTAGMMFVGVLTGAVLARVVNTRRRPQGRLAVAVGTAAVAAVFAVQPLIIVSRDHAPGPVDQLATFLVAHDLHQGVGDYWSASIVTVRSHHAVRVRPIVSAPGGRIVRYTKQSDAAWYDGQSFQFVVFDTDYPFGNVDAITITKTFGTPTTTYAVGTYRVLVYQPDVKVNSLGFH